MSDFQTLLSMIFAGVITMILFILKIFLFNKKKLSEKDVPDFKITGADDAKRLSKKINKICAALFIPSIAICIFCAVCVAMGGETILTGLGAFQRICIGISLFLFLATPISIIIGVVLSLIYRKKEKFVLSVMVQYVPFTVFLVAFLPVIIALALLFLNIRI